MHMQSFACFSPTKRHLQNIRNKTFTMLRKSTEVNSNFMFSHVHPLKNNNNNTQQNQNVNLSSVWRQSVPQSVMKGAA